MPTDRPSSVRLAVRPTTAALHLLTLLRQRTREHHARLDAGIDFRSGRITPERYSAFLRGVLAVVSPLEPALGPLLGPNAAPSRIGCLRADLAQLGSPGVVESARVTSPRNTTEAYGCAYVLEGSALGGLVLAPLIEEQLGGNVATSYLRLHGANTARVWQAWLRRLETFGAAATADDADAACAMACATFDAYTASLRSTGALEESCACIR